MVNITYSAIVSRMQGNDSRLESETRCKSAHQESSDNFSDRGMLVDSRLETLGNTPHAVSKDDEVSIMATPAYVLTCRTINILSRLD